MPINFLSNKTNKGIAYIRNDTARCIRQIRQAVRLQKIETKLATKGGFINGNTRKSDSKPM